MSLITTRENLIMLMLTEQHCSEGRAVISCYLFMLLPTEEPGGDNRNAGDSFGVVTLGIKQTKTWSCKCGQILWFRLSNLNQITMRGIQKHRINKDWESKLQLFFPTSRSFSHGIKNVIIGFTKAESFKCNSDHLGLKISVYPMMAALPFCAQTMQFQSSSRWSQVT